MKNRYVSGRYFEYKTRKALEKEGYYVVRSAGSKGAVDLVALGEIGIRLVQVKSGASRVDRNEVSRKFSKIKTRKGCFKELWIYRDGQVSKEAF